MLGSPWEHMCDHRVFAIASLEENDEDETYLFLN